MAAILTRSVRRIESAASAKHIDRLSFNKMGGDGTGKANIVSDQDAEVWGVAYLCSPEALDELDQAEGVPDHYVRRSVNVALDNGDFLNAIAYVANPNKLAEGLKPSPEYLQYVLRGIRYHQLPESQFALVEELGRRTL